MSKPWIILQIRMSKERLNGHCSLSQNSYIITSQQEDELCLVRLWLIAYLQSAGGGMIMYY